MTIAAKHLERFCSYVEIVYNGCKKRIAIPLYDSEWIHKCKFFGRVNEVCWRNEKSGTQQRSARTMFRAHMLELVCSSSSQKANIRAHFGVNNLVVSFSRGVWAWKQCRSLCLINNTNSPNQIVGFPKIPTPFCLVSVPICCLYLLLWLFACCVQFCHC